MDTVNNNEYYEYVENMAKIQINFDKERERRLNKYLGYVCTYLMLATLVCGTTSYFVSKSKTFMSFYANNQFLMFLLTFVPLVVMIIYLKHNTEKRNGKFASSLLCFIAMSTLLGLTLSPIFLEYTTSSILLVFFTSAIIFALSAGYGIAVQRDLSNYGAILTIGLLGILCVSILNYYIDSKPLDYAISIIGVLIFVGLTIYDFNKIKNQYNMHGDSAQEKKNALFDSFDVFLDLLNIFMYLMNLLGEKKSMEIVEFSNADDINCNRDYCLNAI